MSVVTDSTRTKDAAMTVSDNANSAGTIILAAAGSNVMAGKGNLIILRMKALKPNYYNSISFKNGTASNYFNEGSPAMTLSNAYCHINALPSISVYPNSSVITNGDNLQFHTYNGTEPYSYHEWWQPAESGSTEGVDLQRTQFSFSSDTRLEGINIGKLEYAFTADDGLCRLYVNPSRIIDLTNEKDRDFGMWVYGDNSGNILQYWFTVNSDNFVVRDMASTSTTN